MGRDSSVGIATRYGLEGLGIESRCGRDFPHPAGPGAYPASCRVGTGSFPGVKRPGSGADHPPSKCRGHKRVELYLSSPSGASWPVIGRPLPFSVPILHCSVIVDEYMSVWNTVEMTAHLTERKAKAPTPRKKYSSATSFTINHTQTSLTLYGLRINNLLNCCRIFKDAVILYSFEL